MATSFDKNLKQGDTVLFKEMYADRAEYGEIVEVRRPWADANVDYIIRPFNQAWAEGLDISYSEDADDEPTVWLITISSTCDEDAVCRWGGPVPSRNGPVATAISEMPANPKKLYGAQKPDLALIPPVADLHMAMALENGASKYGAYNWRDIPVEVMTYIAAAKRHLDLFLDGQDFSSDTNPPVHNLGHVMACCAIVLDSQELGSLIDNRPKPGASETVQNRMKAAKATAMQALISKLGVP